MNKIEKFASKIAGTVDEFVEKMAAQTGLPEQAIRDQVIVAVQTRLDADVVGARPLPDRGDETEAA